MLRGRNKGESELRAKRTEVEHREIAANDAAADRLSLALAGAAGAVAERSCEARAK